MKQNLKIFGMLLTVCYGMFAMDGGGSGVLAKTNSGSKHSSRTASPVLACPAESLSEVVMATSSRSPRRSASLQNLHDAATAVVAAAQKSSTPSNSGSLFSSKDGSEESPGMCPLQLVAAQDGVQFYLGAGNQNFSQEQRQLVLELQTKLTEDVKGFTDVNIGTRVIDFSNMRERLGAYLIFQRNAKETLDQQVMKLSARPVPQQLAELQLELQAAKAEVDRLKLLVPPQRAGSVVYPTPRSVSASSGSSLSTTSAPSLSAAAAAAVVSSSSSSSSSATTPITATTTSPDRGGAFSPDPSAPGSDTKEQQLKQQLTAEQLRVADLEKRLKLWQRFYTPSATVIGSSVGFLIRHFGPMLFPLGK